MPSKSEAQARMMRAVAHGWRKPGLPSRAVASEFVDADAKKSAAMARHLRRKAKHREPDADEAGGMSDYDADNRGV